MKDNRRDFRQVYCQDNRSGYMQLFQALSEHSHTNATRTVCPEKVLTMTDL
jgi:hypothetical protein